MNIVMLSSGSLIIYRVRSRGAGRRTNAWIGSLFSIALKANTDGRGGLYFRDSLATYSKRQLWLGNKIVMDKSKISRKERISTYRSKDKILSILVTILIQRWLKRWILRNQKSQIKNQRIISVWGDSMSWLEEAEKWIV